MRGAVNMTDYIWTGKMMIRQQGYSVIRRGLIIMMLRLLCLKEVRYTVMVKALLL